MVLFQLPSFLTRCCRSEAKSFSLYIFLYKYPILVKFPLSLSADVLCVFIFFSISFRDLQECVYFQWGKAPLKQVSCLPCDSCFWKKKKNFQGELGCHQGNPLDLSLQFSYFLILWGYLLLQSELGIDIAICYSQLLLREARSGGFHQSFPMLTI